MAAKNRAIRQPEPSNPSEVTGKLAEAAAWREARRHLRIRELASVAVLGGMIFFGPLLVGEMFPFTLSPMFSDRPQFYYRYTVRDPDGEYLPLEWFDLQLIYDGNPEGYGVGIAPPPTVNQFSQRIEPSAILAHIQSRLRREDRWAWVEVERQTVGAKNSTVGVVRTERWVIERESETEL